MRLGVVQRARVPFGAARLIACAAVVAVLGCGSRVRTISNQPIALEGEIIDPQCWYTHGARGLGHRSCAIYCARGGQDLAFLNRVGERVTPIIASAHGRDPNDSLLAYVGVPVVVRGALYGRGEERVLRVDAIRRVDGLPPDPLPADTGRVDPMPHGPLPLGAVIVAPSPRPASTR